MNLQSTKRQTDQDTGIIKFDYQDLDDGQLEQLFKMMNSKTQFNTISLKGNQLTSKSLETILKNAPKFNIERVYLQQNDLDQNLSMALTHVD